MQRSVAQLPDILFYIFAALTLLCGFLVVLNPFSRNPVTSAMFLVLTIASLAGLVRAAARVLPRGGAGPGLCGRGHGAVPVRHHAAGSARRRSGAKSKRSAIVPGLISVGAIVAIFLQSLRAIGLQLGTPAPTLEGGTDSARQAACSPNTCCRLKLSPCCCSWRWWA